MPKQAIRWACETCAKEHVTETDASACEARHAAERRRNLIYELYPLRHTGSDGYRTCCVRCGETLSESERVFDGHRHERGRLIVDRPFSTLFGGCYCQPCYTEAVEEIAIAVAAHRAATA